MTARKIGYQILNEISADYHLETSNLTLDDLLETASEQIPWWADSDLERVLTALMDDPTLDAEDAVRQTSGHIS